MNVAFGTLIILFLLSPGFALRYTFLKGPYSRKISKPPTSEEVFWSIIPAVIIQLICVSLLSCMSVHPDLREFYWIAVGASHAEMDFTLILADIPWFLLYQCTLILIAAVLGYCTRIAAIRFQWDKKLSFLEVPNEWYYLFSGRILDDYQLIELIQVDLLTHSSEGDIIYCGVLKDYFLNAQGAIDRIYLSNVYRRTFKNDSVSGRTMQDKSVDERYYSMPGDYMVFFGKEITNLNVTYYQLLTEEDLKDE